MPLREEGSSHVQVREQPEARGQALERSKQPRVREVPVMQAQEYGSDSRGTGGSTVWGAAPRLLETPDGGWGLFRVNRRIARIPRAEIGRRTLKIAGHEEPVEVTVYIINRIFWDHARGLQQLQGFPPADLIGPNYLVLNAVKGAPYSTRPHLRSVVMVMLHRVPNSMNLLELFGELRKRFCA